MADKGSDFDFRNYYSCYSIFAQKGTKQDLFLFDNINKSNFAKAKSEIIKRHSIQRVNSHNGEKAQTLLDTVLSLIDFHKEHAHLFTYCLWLLSWFNRRV